MGLASFDPLHWGHDPFNINFAYGELTRSLVVFLPPDVPLKVGACNMADVGR